MRSEHSRCGDLFAPLLSGLSDDKSAQAMAVGVGGRLVVSRVGSREEPFRNKHQRPVRSHPSGPSANVHQGLCASEL